MTETAIGEQPPVRFEPAALARILALILPLGLLGGAMGSQYLGGLNPCEMCYWQRWPHGLAIGLATLAFVTPVNSQSTRLFTLLAAAAIAVSGGIGIYHAGVEAGIFEGFTTCAAGASAAGSGDLFDQIMGAPLVRCDQVQWSFLGVSMAGWNAILSIGGAAAIALLALAGRRG